MYAPTGCLHVRHNDTHETKAEILTLLKSSGAIYVQTAHIRSIQKQDSATLRLPVVRTYFRELTNFDQSNARITDPTPDAMSRYVAVVSSRTEIRELDSS